MIITLSDVTPIPRYDGKPWTLARIEEAPTASGEWTAVRTDALTEDEDPKNPVSHNFTFESALDAGWYRIVFIDEDAKEQVPTQPVMNEPSIPWMPTVQQVAELLRVRTRDSNGVELGQFTADTRPTYEQAEDILQMAARDVEAQIDNEIPAESYLSAAGAITLLAASRIELSFFPEQIATGRSPYQYLVPQFEAALARLQVSVGRERAELGETPVSSNSPAWTFPAAQELRW